MIEHVISAIAADFADRKVSCEVRLDKRFLHENASPPRIVVVPTTDKFRPPLQVQRPAGTTPSFGGGANPRPLRTRVVGADAHIWAAAPVQQNESEQLPADYAAVGVLLNQFVAALNRIAAGIFELESGVLDQRTLIVKRGLVYRLSFTVMVPVTDDPWETVSGLVAAIDVQVMGDDGTTPIATTHIQAP